MLSTNKGEGDPRSELRTDLDRWPPDVVRVYVLQGVGGSEDIATLALVENDPGRVEAGEQVFRVAEELRVREWRAGRAALAAGLV
ncbi:MAG: hypothetical protein M3356_04545 [Actinomycetota bacterium]|nr:hypothetical protein [Actinomycetota bacterium]